MVQLMGGSESDFVDPISESPYHLYRELSDLEFGQDRPQQTDDLCVWDHGIP